MRRSAGFTLIEVMVALTLGAIVLVLAHRLFTGVTDGAARLAEARRALDREANARRWLVAAFGSLDVGDQSGGFTGEPGRVEFGSWQLTPEGWYARRHVIVERQDSSLVALLSPNNAIVLSHGVTNFQADYLLDVGSEGPSDSTPGAPGEHARFVHEWISPVSAPIAIRLRITHADGADTLLLIVGPRG